MITSHDIARIAGVSRGTVDRVLNNRPNVSPEAREKVLQAVKKLDYRPNHIASSLSKQRTNTVGIVVFDLKNRFFSQFVDRCEVQLRTNGYFTYLMASHKSVEDEIACVKMLKDRRTDGIIIMPIGLGDTLKALEGANVVTFENRLGELPHIGIDEYQAGAMAARHILSKGYTKAVYIAPSSIQSDDINIWAQQQRYQGFLSIMQARLTNMQAFEAQISALEKGTAVFCATDLYALRVHRLLRQQGITPGKEIGIMGFDNIDTIEFVEPKITTVSLEIEQLGKAAADRMISIIENKAFTPTTIHAKIEEGITL